MESSTPHAFHSKCLSGGNEKGEPTPSFAQIAHGDALVAEDQRTNPDHVQTTCSVRVGFISHSTFTGPSAQKSPTNAYLRISSAGYCTLP